MSFFDILDDLVNAIIPLGICVVLPLIMAWISYRKKQHETDRRTNIIMAAIEKNGDIDVQEYFNKLTPQQRPYKERLAMRLHIEVLFGSMLTLFGVLDIVACVVGSYFLDAGNYDMLVMFSIFGIIALAIGVGLLIAYYSGKRHLETLTEE